MTYQTDTAIGGVSLVDRIAALRTALSERRAKRAVYNNTLRELSGLSDRDLSDLGMHRSMIRQVAQDAAYGK